MVGGFAAQVSLQLAERRLRPAGMTADPAALLGVLPVATILLDAGDRFCYANAAAEEMLGLSLAQLGSLRLTGLLPEDHPLVALVEQVRRRGAAVSGREIVVESPRLQRRELTVHLAPAADLAGGVLLTLQDDTQARILDRQMSNRRAARSVAGLAAMLAHEVKNPLSGIRGAAQLLENSVVEADRELAVLIRDEADRIRALVERMEAFDEKPVARGAVNIHRVLEHVRRLAQSGFAAHLRLTERYDPSLPPVWGNRDLLVQVLLNLVKNAAEAIAEGGRGGEITLTTAYQHGVRLAAPGGGGMVHLPLLVVVRDDGPGIPEALRDTIFEPFVTGRPAGTGLGLALVAKVIGDLGGLIEVDSKPGRTEFRLYLPLYPEDADTGPR